MFKIQIQSLKKELHTITRERDDALFRLEHAQKTVEEMRQSVLETGRLKAVFEHLKQDHESLQISLDSSERIRKQQKELIHVLQRSHSVSDNISIKSISTIGSHVSGNISAQHSMTTSLAAENRSWLNTCSSANSVTSNSRVGNDKYGQIPIELREGENQNSKKRIIKKKTNVNSTIKKELPSSLFSSDRRGSNTSIRSGKLDSSNNNISVHSMPSRLSKVVDYQQKKSNSRKVTTTSTGKTMNNAINTTSLSGKRVQSQSLYDTSNNDSERLGINRPPRYPKSSSNNNGIKQAVNNLINEQKKRSNSVPLISLAHNDKKSIGYTNASRLNNSSSLRSNTYGTSYH